MLQTVGRGIVCLHVSLVQLQQIEVSQLEPEIAMATDCKVVTYNKGL